MTPLGRLRSEFGRFAPPRLLQVAARRLGNDVRTVGVAPAGCDLRYITSPADDLFTHAYFGGLTRWEDTSLATWKQYARESRLVLDIGSYTGVYALVAATVGANRVKAFEPNPFIREFLQRNVAVNQFDNRISVEELALGRERGTLSLLAPALRPTSSGIQLSNVTAADRDTSTWKDIGQVQVRSLNEFLARDEIEELDLIKIDAEGAELDVISGAVDVLTLTTPTIFVECLSAEQLRAVSELLASCGYGEPRWLGPPGFREDEEVTWNAPGHYKNFLFNRP